MRAIIALFLALAIGVAPLGFSTGVAPRTDSTAVAADCGDCNCDSTDLGCGKTVACALQCAFSVVAVLPLAPRPATAETVTGTALIPDKPSAFSIRPPLPPPQG